MSKWVRQVHRWLRARHIRHHILVREGPPLLFDLGTLQEVCSKQMGLDVQETLEIAQALYETHKATTYPRSDSGYLPVSMFAEVPLVLDSLLRTDPSLRPIMDQLDPAQRSAIEARRAG
mgnify:CR=1 FL=1